MNCLVKPLPEDGVKMYTETCRGYMMVLLTSFNHSKIIVYMTYGALVGNYMNVRTSNLAKLQPVGCLS